MAKLPAPKKAAVSARAGSTGMAMEKTTVQSEAVGKFDKFGLFALLVPSVVLALVGLLLAISYTSSHFEVGFLGVLPGAKKELSWNAGDESVTIKKAGGATITGFECDNYIARQQNGDVDVAVIDAGTMHNVHVGDVFTLDGMAEDTAKKVRLEFVVFEVMPSVSRAYILLGEDVSANAGKRSYSLARTKITALCGAEKDIKVKRLWKDQIVRRYVEARSTKQ
ncbi:MAG: hypothetical protein IT462_07470 [Planctomycetes bacterium]|nr:hypothetical protein [Planctomycetota bacterium]